MSLYGEYLKERAGKEIVETDQGFAVFSQPSPQSCYIEDIYVRPELRQQGVAKHFADHISALAKGRGCTTLIGSVCQGAQGDTESLKVLLAYGMRLAEINGNMIYMTKDL